MAAHWCGMYLSWASERTEPMSETACKLSLNGRWCVTHKQLWSQCTGAAEPTVASEGPQSRFVTHGGSTWDNEKQEFLGEGAQAESHDYTSTACQHGLHDRCRKECKFCGAKCQCPHHLAAPAAPESPSEQHECQHIHIETLGKERVPYCQDCGRTLRIEAQPAAPEPRSEPQAEDIRWVETPEGNLKPTLQPAIPSEPPQIPERLEKFVGMILADYPDEYDDSDGQMMNWLADKLKDAESALSAAQKRIAELEARNG